MSTQEYILSDSVTQLGTHGITCTCSSLPFIHVHVHNVDILFKTDHSTTSTLVHEYTSTTDKTSHNR